MTGNILAINIYDINTNINNNSNRKKNFKKT